MRVFKFTNIYAQCPICYELFWRDKCPHTKFNIIDALKDEEEKNSEEIEKR